jgi:hypothetical protein
MHLQETAAAAAAAAARAQWTHMIVSIMVLIHNPCNTMPPASTAAVTMCH